MKFFVQHGSRFYRDRSAVLFSFPSDGGPGEGVAPAGPGQLAAWAPSASVVSHGCTIAYQLQSEDRSRALSSAQLRPGSAGPDFTVNSSVFYFKMF